MPTGQAESFLGELIKSLHDHQRDLDMIIRQRSEGLRNEAGDIDP